MNMWLVGCCVCVFYNIQSVVTALIRRTTLSQGHFWKHLVVAFFYVSIYYMYGGADIMLTMLILRQRSTHFTKNSGKSK